MLIVRLEAWTHQPRPLGELSIRNDGTGDAVTGHYEVRLLSQDPHGPQTVRAARVEHYPRALGAWQLVQCALLALGIPAQEDAPHATP